MLQTSKALDSDNSKQPRNAQYIGLICKAIHDRWCLGMVIIQCRHRNCPVIDMGPVGDPHRRGMCLKMAWKPVRGAFDRGKFGCGSFRWRRLCSRTPRPQRRNQRKVGMKVLGNRLCARLTTSTSALRKGLVRLRTAARIFSASSRGFLDGGCVEARTRNRLPPLARHQRTQSFPSPEYMQSNPHTWPTRLR